VQFTVYEGTSVHVTVHEGTSVQFTVYEGTALRNARSFRKAVTVLEHF